MIRLKSGVCRCGKKLMRPGDGAFSLSSVEEAYLVKSGNAEYVQTEAATEAVATPPVAPEGDGTSVTLPVGNPPAEGTETADLLTAEQLEGMKLDEMRSYCEQLGIDTAGMRYKKDIITAYVEYLSPATDGEDLPNLSVEEPVV